MRRLETQYFVLQLCFLWPSKTFISKKKVRDLSVRTSRSDWPRLPHLSPFFLPSHSALVRVNITHRPGGNDRFPTG